MYRVFLFITVLAYCSSVPLTASNVQKPVVNEQNDLSDLVDIGGAGYSYFKKQKIDGRPSTKSSIDIPMEDLSVYMQANAFNQQPTQKQTFSSMNNILLNNAFGQQQLMPRANFPKENLLPTMVPIQQPAFIQNDFPRLSSNIPNKYAAQQGNFPIQSQLLNNQDLRGIGSQRQQQILNSFGNQQPQQIWSNTQQKSGGFSSSYGGQGQSPFSSGFLIQSNQQNDQPPITNALFMSSPLPPQRFNPSNQQLSNNGW